MEAFKANERTYYNPVTKVKERRLLGYFSIFALSLVLSLVNQNSQEIGSSLISVMGVLLGFGFNIQFFLADTNKLNIEYSSYLEDKEDARVLNELSDEIYDNVVYLNYLALTSLILALFISIQPPEFLKFENDVLRTFYFKGGQFLLIFATGNFLLTLFRVLMRSSLFFAERKRLLPS